LGPLPSPNALRRPKYDWTKYRGEDLSDGTSRVALMVFLGSILGDKTLIRDA